MPFCVYIWNNGTGTAPIWQLRLSAHVLIGGVWTLQTVTSSSEIVAGGRYHVRAAVSGSRVALRVARYRDPSEVATLENEVTFSGTLAWNRCPIQVFDCPQEFVVATTTGTATQRPGLQQTSGSWFFNSMRAPATIDDITIWRGDLTLSSLDRRDKVVPNGDIAMVNHWSMNGPSLEYLTEDTGRGNHLFMCPRGPVYVNDDGGKEGGSYFFNGVTSCAQIVTQTAAWRGSADASLEGAFANIVRQNMPHGIAVDFWLDSIEPRYSQVICEIHSVMRLAIDATGQLVVSVRDGQPGGTIGAPTTLQEIGATYQVVPTGIQFAAGRRYHVAALRNNDGAGVDVYVDGKLALTAGVNPSNYDNSVGSPGPTLSGNSYPPGGITVGFGSLERMIRGPSAADIAPSEYVNTDHTSGFVGRVESFSILAGENAVQGLQRHGPEDADNWRFPELRTWKNPRGGVRNQAWTAEEIDIVRNAGRGSVIVFSTQQDLQGNFPIAIDLTTGLTYYQLGGDTDQDNIPFGILGHGNGSIPVTPEGLGARVYYVFSYYRFNVDHRRDIAAGSYVRGWERQYNAGGALVNSPLRNESKHTHFQYASLSDEVGNLGRVYLQAIEADWQIQTDASIFPVTNARPYTYRNRPYVVRSPWELGVQWAESLCDDPVGTTPVRLYADYDVQTDNRRLGVAACGKNLYWARKAWDAGELLFTGGRGSFALAHTDPANEPELTQGGSVGPVDPLQVTFWCKPLRLDGRRTVMAKRFMGTGIESLPNWMVYTDDGAITVVGVDSVGEAWRFVEAQANAANTEFLQSNTLKVGKWNHVCIQFHPADVQVWVNGEKVDMLDTSTLVGANQTSNTYAGNGVGTAPTQLYFGGYPEDFGVSPIGIAGVSTYVIYPNEVGWYGYLADVQIRTSLDTSRFSGNQGYPRRRFAVDSESLYAWPLNDGDGYLLNNAAAATSAFNAESHIREFELVRSGIQQEEGRHYDSVNFRDALIVTNGADYPHKLSFRGFDVTKPWRAERLGMEAPVPVDFDVEVAGGGGSGIDNGEYIVAVSFLNDEGLESDAVTIGSYTLTTGPWTSLTLSVRNIPRSHDSQVVARRLYVSSTGGGTPIFSRDIPDNDTWWTDFTIYASSGAAAESGNRGPAPRARHCAIAGSSLCLADLPDADAGQNAFAFSTNNEASYFPLTTTVTIDSEDGRPIVGIGHNLNEVFFSKRDSVYKLSVGAIVSALQLDARVERVQASDGFGGGVAHGDNMIFGGGDRGVFRFNNVDLAELTEQIERTWREDVDRSNEGLYGMFGAFWRSYSQYWIGLRIGSETNNVILVFDVASGAWTRLDGVEHGWMGTLELDDGDPVVAIGGLDGRIYGYNDNSLIDRTDDAPVGLGAVTLTASTGLSGSATQLTIASGRFQAILAGMVGANITITYQTSNGPATAIRTIESNDSLNVFWREPLADWVSHVSFTIGAYAGYWTSAWLKQNNVGHPQLMTSLHLEFEPRAGLLQVDIVSLQGDEGPERAWPTPVDETMSLVPMNTGTTERALFTRANKSGMYHRFRCGTYGINDPFALQRFSVDIDGSRSKSATGRRS